MTLRKHLLAGVVLLALSGVFLGCSDSTTTPVGADEAPMVAPSQVVATIKSGGSVEITWAPSTQLNLRGYNVYRIDRRTGDGGRLNDWIITANRYLDDSTERGRRYEYRVTAVSATNTESAFSAVIVATPSTGATKREFSY
ncbi:MAG: fibronectin type III domain-containing protein [Candidatus Krumholzibacteria bacterium]|nr:fibronectin type III domain-containing protein [Candidatus Krumholzibacteria bacterium]